MTISRRDFFRIGGAAGIAVAGSSIPGWAGTTQRAGANWSGSHGTVDVEALVIGSGFGGAIAALRLTQAGVNVVVLERGRRWDIKDPTANATFATFDNPDERSSWMSTVTTDLIPTPITPYAGVFELIDPFGTGVPPGISTDLRPLRAQGVAVRNGAGVGGGSLVYNAIHLQPRRKWFHKVFPRTIDYDEMDNLFYPRVRRMLGQATMPQDILNSPYYGSTRANLQNAKNAGMYPGMPVEVNVDWDVVRDEINGTKVPSAIDGQSWFGLNSGAKNSVDKNYLRLAQQSGRCDVLPLHVVTGIEEASRGGGYIVTALQIDEWGQTQRTVRFRCRYLFFAAGACGTPTLLVKARAKGMLPRLSQFVGRFWGGNGDFIAVRGGVGNFPPGEGGPCGHIYAEDKSMQGRVTGLVELVIPKNYAQLALGGAPGFSLYVGLGLAPALGRFRYNRQTDLVTLSWPNTDPRLAGFSAGVNAMLGTLAARNPGSFTAFNTEDPAYQASGGPALTAHPVGGAVMGAVCDDAGRVYGYENMYIVDGSIIPGGSVGGVNPAWTIAALAERSMDRILDHDECGRRSRYSSASS